MVSFPTLDGIGGIGKAFNRVEHHDTLVTAYEQRAERRRRMRVMNALYAFSGNRVGLDDEKGLDKLRGRVEKDIAAGRKIEGDAVHGTA